MDPLSIDLNSSAYANATTNETTYPLYSHPTYMLVLVTIFKVVIFIVGIVGNVMVMLVVKKNTSLRNSTNLFLVNLSVADLAVILLCVPSNMAEFYGEQVWFLGNVMCKLVYFLQYAGITASVLIILAISFERYFAICQPLKAKYMCTMTRTIKAIIGIWIAALVLNIPFLTFVASRRSTDSEGNQFEMCVMIPTKEKEAFINSHVVLFFVIPFVSLLYTYGRIMQCLLAKKEHILSDGKQPMMEQLTRQRKQVVFMLLAVVVIFFACLTPFRVLTVWIIYVKGQTLGEMGHEGFNNLLYFSRIMYLINSAANPILYNIFSSQFRRAFKHLFCSKYFERTSSLLRTTTAGSINVKLPSSRPLCMDNQANGRANLFQNITA